MNEKKVLVLLSSYNGEKYIEDQIESVMNQDIVPDLLIRDDGSKDNTLNVVKKLIDKYPNRISLIEGTNIGLNKSFFELIKMGNGYDYYSICDQDDVWFENKLSVAVEWLSKEDNSKPLLYGSSSYFVHDDMVVYGQTQLQQREFTIYNSIIQTFLPGHNHVMNQALLNELKIDIDYANVYVYDSWITNVAMLKGKILFNNESFVYYRQHENNAVGFGRGKLGWFKERIRRIKKKDSQKYMRQTIMFYEIYKNELSDECEREIRSFIECNTSLFKRIGYISKSKLYRQSNMQTLLFKVLYALGGYKL